MAEALFLTLQVIGVLFLIFLWSYYLPVKFIRWLIDIKAKERGLTGRYIVELDQRRKLWTYSWLAFFVIYTACHVYLKYFNI